jgi:YfiH family protein
MAVAGLIVPVWPDAPANVGAFATTRAGGFSVGPYGDGNGGGGLNLGLHVGDDVASVQCNRALLQELLPGRPAWIAQVHGVAVADAAAVVNGAHASAPTKGQTHGSVPLSVAGNAAKGQTHGSVPLSVAENAAKGQTHGSVPLSAAGNSTPAVTVADASIARLPGVVSAVLTADCLPVLFADMDGKVVASAHAGWRGLAGGVLGTTIAAMRAAGAGDITAWLGPAIGPERFEVGEDVRDAFVAALGAQTAAPAFLPYAGRPGKYLANMPMLARAFLARDGVTSVAGGEHCTVTDAAQFYSYRRDGVSGRQATLIWLK